MQADREKAGRWVFGAPIIQSPAKDFRALKSARNWRPPPRGVWIWAATCAALFVFTIYPGGFLANAALRLTLIGGGWAVVAQNRRQQRDGDYLEQQPLSWVFSLILVGLVTLGLFVVGGFVMQVTGAE